MIKNIIFDFDGVLVDSEILVAKAFAKYMQNSGIDVDEKEFASLAGKKTVQVIDILSKKYSIKDQEKFFRDIMEIASNIYKKELTTVKGAYDFVSNLKFNMFIGSNSMKERIIKEDEDANITLFDPEIEWVFKANDIKSKSSSTPFIGHKLKGKALAIFNNGQFKEC